MFDIRPALPSDLIFVDHAWAHSFEAFSEIAKLDRLKYRRFMPVLVERLRLEPGAQTRVAFDLEDQDTLLGFAVLTGQELHYVYVKQAVRKLGIVPRLLEGTEIRYITSKTDAAEDRLRASARGWEYRPRVVV